MSALNKTVVVNVKIAGVTALTITLSTSDPIKDSVTALIGAHNAAALCPVCFGL